MLGCWNDEMSPDGGRRPAGDDLRDQGCAAGRYKPPVSVTYRGVGGVKKL